MKNKLMLFLVFLFLGVGNAFSQTTIGRIYFHYRNSMVMENHDVKITINPFPENQKTALLEIEIYKKDKVSLKIPIEKYNELTQAILKINPSDFTKDMKFCADGASIEIGFGASDRATYSLSCVSPEYEKHKDVVFVVKLIMEISKVKLNDF